MDGSRAGRRAAGGSQPSLGRGALDVAELDAIGGDRADRSSSAWHRHPSFDRAARRAHDGARHPGTTVPRTLFDLAAVLVRHQVERAINEADVRRLTDPLSLADLLARYPRRWPVVRMRLPVAPARRDRRARRLGGPRDRGCLRTRPRSGPASAVSRMAADPRHLATAARAPGAVAYDLRKLLSSSVGTTPARSTFQVPSSS
jgi:hypothetical protein